MLLLAVMFTAMTAWAADVTLSGSDNYTAQDGDVLTGSTSGTVTIADGASVTLFNTNITNGIVCEGSATITLVGTNSVKGANWYAGIQVGGAGTTLTIKGDGSLTATGGSRSAGIGLSYKDVTGGNIVIEGGNITAIGGPEDNYNNANVFYGAGIGTGLYNQDVSLGNITIKGGIVSATGYSGIGAGKTWETSISLGPLVIYDTSDEVIASSISMAVTYKHLEKDVTRKPTKYFQIIEDGDRRIVVSKNRNTDFTDGIAYDYNPHYDINVSRATFKKQRIGSERVGKYQALLVPFDYTITDDDLQKFTFYKINMIANSPSPSVEASDEMWVFLTRLDAGAVLHGNMPYVYKPLEAVTDYEFTTENATLKAKNTDILLDTRTTEDIYSFYATYDNTTATADDPFYYVNIDGDISYGDAVTVGPYRWIIRKTSKFGDTPQYARRMYFHDGEPSALVPTGIATVATEAVDGSDNWYTLDGRQLSGKPMQRGVYVNNGRKVIIK